MRTTSSQEKGKRTSASWETAASFRARLLDPRVARDSPKISTNPEEGERMPVSAKRRVVLPEPLGPRIPTNSPR